MLLLMKGNEAIAQAAIESGCKCYFGYPITPQTEISAYMAKTMPNSNGVFIQAESEISAINMVLGASSAGVRAMTSSSSPGISLKTEAISYMAGSDLPCVIINVARAGPGLGGIRPSQSDYFQATKALGHGDFYVIVLAPATVAECASLTITAFNLADKYRTPVMLLLDGMIGQMMEPVDFSLLPKVEDYRKDWATTGHKNEREKNVVTSIYLETQILEKTVLDRFERYEMIKEKEVRFESYLIEDAQIIITAFGATARIAKSAVDQLRAKGIAVGLFRPITLFPFPSKEIQNLPCSVTEILCVEMNMGQMVEDVKLAINGQRQVHFYGRTGGEVPSVQEICEQVQTIRRDSYRCNI